MLHNNIYIIVVAGGSGSRFGAKLPKQYCDLNGKPVLCHTIEHLLSALPRAKVITVVSESMLPLWQELAAKHNCHSGHIVAGGSTRWESVKNALDSISEINDNDIVLVHDGARPLVDSKTVTDVVKACDYGCSVVPVIPVTDSLRLLDYNGNSKPVNRSDYRAVVTPQGFMLKDLRQAYNLPYNESFTDDASVMTAAGYQSTTLVGSLPINIKITNPGDLAIAAWYLNNNKSE